MDYTSSIRCKGDGQGAVGPSSSSMRASLDHRILNKGFDFHGLTAHHLDALGSAKGEKTYLGRSRPVVFEGFVCYVPSGERPWTLRRESLVKKKFHKSPKHKQSMTNRRRHFETKQIFDRKLDDNCNMGLMDGGIRRSSSSNMTERTMKLWRTIELYQKHLRSLSCCNRLVNCFTLPRSRGLTAAEMMARSPTSSRQNGDTIQEF